MKTLLVIGSGDEVYREYSLRSIAERYSIVLLQEPAPTWQRKYIIDSVSVSMSDQEAAVAAAKALAARHQIDGIFTYEEPSVEIAARIAAELGLKYSSRESTKICRDKFLMRQAFEEFKVPSCISRLVHSLDEAKTTAAEIGYPIVLKPRAMASSLGVVKVDSEQELQAAFSISTAATHSRYSNDQGLLVEEYMDGPEISVESAVIGGEVHIVAVTRKKIGFPPFFEEVGHVVSPAEPIDNIKAVHDVVIRAHKALDILQGVTHSELRLSQRGPRMVELGARLGGDLIPYLVKLATGVDLSLAAADIAVGAAPQLEHTKCLAATVRFLYPEHDVRVRDLSVDEVVFSWEGVDRVVWELAPGDTMKLPPRDFSMRLGMVIVTAQDGNACEELIDRVLEKASLDLEKLEMAD